MSAEIRFVIASLVLTLAVVLGIKFVFPLFAPFAFGMFFACLLEPILLKTEKLCGIKRRQTAMILIVIMIGVIFFISLLGIFFICSECRNRLTELVKFAERLQLSNNSEWCFGEHVYSFAELKTIFDSSLKQILNQLLTYSMKIPAVLGKLLTCLILGGFAAHFFIVNDKIWRVVVCKLLPQRHRELYLRFGEEIFRGMVCFFRTQLLLALLTMLLTTLFFAILHFRGFWGYGVLAGFLDLIPVLGPGLLYVPMILIMFLFGHYTTALILLLFYMILIFWRQWLEFRLLGENFELAPLLVMISIYSGMKIFGFSGMFFGPLILLLIRACYRYFTALPRYEEET